MTDQSVRYVDMTPTWASLMPAWFAVLEDGTDEGKKAGREEIMRLAKAYDDVSADYKKDHGLCIVTEHFPLKDGKTTKQTIVYSRESAGRFIAARAKERFLELNPKASAEGKTMWDMLEGLTKHGIFFHEEYHKVDLTLLRTTEEYAQSDPVKG